RREPDERVAGAIRRRQASVCTYGFELVRLIIRENHGPRGKQFDGRTSFVPRGRPRRAVGGLPVARLPRHHDAGGGLDAGAPCAGGTAAASAGANAASAGSDGAATVPARIRTPGAAAAIPAAIRSKRVFRERLSGAPANRLPRRSRLVRTSRGSERIRKAGRNECLRTPDPAGA